MTYLYASKPQNKIRCNIHHLFQCGLGGFRLESNPLNMREVDGLIFAPQTPLSMGNCTSFPDLKLFPQPIYISLKNVKRV